MILQKAKEYAETFAGRVSLSVWWSVCHLFLLGDFITSHFCWPVYYAMQLVTPVCVYVW